MELTILLFYMLSMQLFSCLYIHKLSFPFGRSPSSDVRFRRRTLGWLVNAPVQAKGSHRDVNSTFHELTNGPCNTLHRHIGPASRPRPTTRSGATESCPRHPLAVTLSISPAPSSSPTPPMPYPSLRGPRRY